MRTRENSLISRLAVLACALLLAATAKAEDTRLNVGFASAKPTDQIDIPITFSGPDGATAGTLIAHIDRKSTRLNSSH